MAGFSGPSSVVFVDSLNVNSAVLPLPVLSAHGTVFTPSRGMGILEDKEFAGVINPWQSFNHGG